jgi:aryl sulfotransferase
LRIHWLASYPKSGNTWVRFLLYQCLYGEVTDTRELVKRIPDAHHEGEFGSAIPDEDRLLLKTHWCFHEKLPHLDNTDGCIYIVRHPKDVLLSALNYMWLGGQQKITDQQYAAAFIQVGGDPRFVELSLGTWEQNVFSWRSQKRVPTLFLKYEDLKTDAPGQLRRMLEFLGRPVDGARIDQAVKLSSFERMRAMEAREKGSRGASPVFGGVASQMKRGRMFMNKGQSGRTLASIGPGLDELFDKRFGALMKELGYEPRS